MPTIDPAPCGATVLGYPRIGRHRELKRATEGYWAGTVSEQELADTGATLRRENWLSLAAAGMTEVPVNDFSFYDHVADMIQLLGVVPPRHRQADTPSAAAIGHRQSALTEYFAMARGTDTAAPLDMTKWFDTNYHYLIPELGPESRFALTEANAKVVDEALEAGRMGLQPRPVLLGPVTFLQLAKPAATADSAFRPLDLLPRLLPVYEKLLAWLVQAGAAWVQLDEPILVADPNAEVLDAMQRALAHLSAASTRPQILVATYFGAASAALPLLRESAVEGIALDFTLPGRRNLDALRACGGLPGKRLVAGVVDGRNVWTNDLTQSMTTLTALRSQADEIVVSTSCSLMHVPVDVEQEPDLPETVRPWLAFAAQKLVEVTALARLASGDSRHLDAALVDNSRQLAARREHPSMHVASIRERLQSISVQDLHRDHPAADRRAIQQARLDLPLFPTTTIGSFPQTAELRAARAAARRDSISGEEYERRIATEIERVVALQESIGLDVLVHGEPERSDMVQYFAEQLTGFITTEHGWVQSYGTRYVRPPILAADVSRPGPMTVRWTTHAQRLTDLPVKGMLTGPVTMLAWSFVRDDEPMSEVANQVALALREEISDLEESGIAIIQVDEPGLRESLPLQAIDRPAYLRWATEAFRLATSGVDDETQIHTHMCYADFGDIAAAIDDLDVDVISLEAARSHTHGDETLAGTNQTYGLGPGVYDIHAPRVPSVGEIVGKLRQAIDHVPIARLWVNPDCGLKTRTDAEVRAALANMVAAARNLRAEVSGG